MTKCDNCGHKLSDDYVRVCLPEDVEAVEMCPNCPHDDRVATKGIWLSKLNKPTNKGE